MPNAPQGKSLPRESGECRAECVAAQIDAQGEMKFAQGFRVVEQNIISMG
jgi:hypothetical protein